MTDRRVNEQGHQKILILCFESLWAFQLGTEIELIQQHRERGDEVRVLACDAGLDSCLANPYHDLATCIECKSVSRRAFDSIGLPAACIEWIRPDTSSKVGCPSFENIGDLRAYGDGQRGVGVGAASSLVSLLRDSKPDMQAHSGLTFALVRTAETVYRSAASAVAKLEPDLTYLFNGRFATSRPAIQACEDFEIRYATHEEWYQTGRYQLVEDGLIHDLEKRKRAMKQLWDRSHLPLEARSLIAEQFFVGRRFGGVGDAMPEYRFAERQDVGRLPGEIKTSGRRRVAIFNSSEDEFTSISGYTNPVYPDQMEALERIVFDERLRDIEFFVRIHPNLQHVDNEQTRRLESIAQATNARLIAADDPIDSYALAEEVDVVVTFGSTVGVEAMYWGTPSVLVGRAPYEELGAIRPQTHDEVVGALAVAQPAPIRDVVLPYGFFMMEGGIRPTHATPLEQQRWVIGGEQLRPGRLAVVLANLVRAARILRHEPRQFLPRLIRFLRQATRGR